MWLNSRHDLNRFNIQASRRSYSWCHSLFSSSFLSVLYQQCSLKTRSVVSSKKTDLKFKKKDFQLLVLLALIFIFKRTRMILKISANSVVSVLGQSCSMTREVMKIHTFLLSRMLLAEEKRDICTFWMYLLLNVNCLQRFSIACRHALLQTTCCFLMTWDCFSTDDQLRQSKYESQILHLDSLILKIDVDYFWCLTLLDCKLCWLE